MWPFFSVLLVDRFILSGTVLLNKREVRYQRSRNKYQPQSRKDSLGAKDMEKNPFYEPTQKLSFIRNLVDGRFTIADICVIYALHFGKFLGHHEYYKPQTLDYLERMTQREAFQRAVAVGAPEPETETE